MRQHNQQCDSTTDAAPGIQPVTANAAEIYEFPVPLSNCTLCGSVRDPNTRRCCNLKCSRDHNAYLEANGICPRCGGLRVLRSFDIPCDHSFHREKVQASSPGPTVQADVAAAEGAMDVPETGAGATPPRASTPTVDFDGPSLLEIELLDAIDRLLSHARPENWDDPDDPQARDAWVNAERMVALCHNRAYRGGLAYFAGGDLVSDQTTMTVGERPNRGGGILVDKARVIAALKRDGHEILSGSELAEQLGQEVEKDAAL